MDKSAGTLENTIESDSGVQSQTTGDSVTEATAQKDNSLKQSSSSNTVSNLKLSKQTTKDSDSPTLVESEEAKQEQEDGQPQEQKGSKLTRFGKRVVDGYNKKASKTNVPVEMLYRLP
ncbi:hypothetical protein BT96DRAFT_134467 [Gymnopus androsaceus JB14]|uniref:Uncharacterized protein n=1 Tax=Gymnopus androsaceus JB14 TaxID=1447944 RepID=A0A6A4HFD2_9AGAR|nr:hypothetical protein BT96DRAFT_134467 [Gymnopus androsaceus JB14]